MTPVEYHMTAADLRTFDRWHARGALILVAALGVMPWLVGIGPNTARTPVGGHDATAATGTASPSAATAGSGTAPPSGTPAPAPVPARAPAASGG